MNLFKRSVRRARAGTAGLVAELGRGLVAARLADGAVVPDDAALVLVMCDAGGRARRSLGPRASLGGKAQGRLALGAGESAYCFHPGPYDTVLVPFAAAPELGLRLRFVVDAADPRVEQQRFDLFLHSEAGERLTLDTLAAALQAALRLELGQGNLALPPCTTLDEWDLFRAGLNQLLYTRFGLTVEDCLPADLGDEVDFAALLAARAQALAVAVAPPVSASVPVFSEEVEAAASTMPAPLPAHPAIAARVTPDAAVDPAAADARALRRLFLELPAATSALRLIALPAGPAPFAAQQALLVRLELASLRAATMPSLAWETPDRPLVLVQQRRRGAACMAAAAALDELWALLARWDQVAEKRAAENQAAENQPAKKQAAENQAEPVLLFDEADRIIANLALALAARHAAQAPLTVDEAPEPGDLATAQRREPT